jgi:hypothetical protein
VPARHRQRAGDQSDQRIDTHGQSCTHADDVLHDQHADDVGGEEQQGNAPARKHPSIGTQTDAGEEGEHESRLQ